MRNYDNLLKEQQKKGWKAINIMTAIAIIIEIITAGCFIAILQKENSLIPYLCLIAIMVMTVVLFVIMTNSVRRGIKKSQEKFISQVIGKDLVTALQKAECYTPNERLLLQALTHFKWNTSLDVVYLSFDGELYCTLPIACKGEKATFVKSIMWSESNPNFVFNLTNGGIKLFPRP